MDSSPKPSPETLPWDEHPVDDLSGVVLWLFGYPNTLANRLLGPTRPMKHAASEDEVRAFAERVEAFVKTAGRFAEAVDALGRLPAPSLKQMGMGVSSLLLRTRELNGKFRQIESSEPIVTELRCVRKPESFGDGELAGRLAVPHWPALMADALERRLETVALSCWRVWESASYVVGEPVDAWEALASMDAIFRRDALPALEGEFGLLKELPKLQEEITRRIYREEFFRGE